MGLIDKIRNIFTEEVEEEEEIKVEQIKKEVRSVPIDSPNVEKKEKAKVERNMDLDDFEDDELELVPKVKEKEEPKAPVFFTERDFEDLIEPKRRADRYDKKERVVEEKKREDEKPKPYGGNYTNNTIIQKEKVTFKPTPIISPVYGVLDKNYHKEDIVDRKEVVHEAADGLSVDSIRNKAYGTLEDDIEEVMTVSTKKRTIADEDDIDFFDELEEATEKKRVETKKKREKDVKEIEEVTIDLTQELDNLLLSKKKYNKVKDEDDDDSSDKPDSLSESDLFNLIDSMYEEGEED